MKKLLLICCLFAFSCHSQSEDKPHVIMVSFDGFRFDYVEKNQLPHFQQFIAEGASAESMIPSFPSKTFPNHYSLVTGLYPGNHGLVDNTFYDSIRDDVYSMRKRALVQDAFYYGGIPLWQLAQRHGLKSASYFWVGSETNVAGSYPDYYTIYDESVKDEDRIHQVINWLQLPEDERPQFISLYFSVIDNIGHAFGPDAVELQDTLHYADHLLGLLMKETDKLNLSVTIVVVSDHGMYPVENVPERHLNPDDFVKEQEGVQMVNSGTHMHIYCADSLRLKIYETIDAKDGPFDVYLRENTPESWNYSSHYRIGDIVVSANAGYNFERMRESDEPVYGAHGYDPYTTPEMGTIFYARGPRIKPGHTVPTFENVHVYPFVATLLGLPLPEIDGSPAVLQGIIRE